MNAFSLLMATVATAARRTSPTINKIHLAYGPRVKETIEFHEFKSYDKEDAKLLGSTKSLTLYTSNTRLKCQADGILDGWVSRIDFSDDKIMIKCRLKERRVDKVGFESETRITCVVDWRYISDASHRGMCLTEFDDIPSELQNGKKALKALIKSCFPGNRPKQKNFSKQKNFNKKYKCVDIMAATPVLDHKNDALEQMMILALKKGIAMPEKGKRIRKTHIPIDEIAQQKQRSAASRLTSAQHTITPQPPLKNDGIIVTPPGWTAVVDQTGPSPATYFINDATGETQWDVPGMKGWTHVFSQTRGWYFYNEKYPGSTLAFSPVTESYIVTYAWD